MHLKRSFAVIGGDLRQRCLLRQLRGLGFPASAYRVPDAEDSAPDLSGCLRGANVLILPMPAGGGVPLANILDAAEPGALICGGMLAPAEALLQARGISFYDYAKDEALLLQNAELTAEAALALLLERLPGPLAGSRILLCGFGRIGKLLCHRLTAMGAHVTAAARRPESLAWAKAYGYETADIGRLEGNLGAFDVVVNTVPEPVFGADRLRELKPDCLCVDVASVQGIDLSAAEALGLECIWARGLPGKLMPKTAGAVIRDTVYTIVKEQGVIL